MSAARCIRLVLLCLGCALAAQCAPDRIDPLLGERPIEGAATAEYLWLRNDAGAVVEFRRADGARRVLANEGVVGMTRSEGRLLGLRALDAERRVYRVFDLASGAPVSPDLALPKVPLALIADDGVTLVSEDALYRLDGDSWRREDLREPVRPYPPISGYTTAASSGDGVIYVGFNFGEFGGDLFAVDPGTRTASQVTTRLDPDRAEALAKLTPKIDLPPRLSLGAVTGLARDLGRSDCVLVSEGVIHYGADGRILRACGAEAEVIFEEAIPRELTGGHSQMTWPFFGVASTSDGWVAVTRGYVFRSSRGAVTRSKTPRLRSRRGLPPAHVGAEFIILTTDANRAHSLSGYTPLLVQITR